MQGMSSDRPRAVRYTENDKRGNIFSQEVRYRATKTGILQKTKTCNNSWPKWIPTIRKQKPPVKTWEGNGLATGNQNGNGWDGQAQQLQSRIKQMPRAHNSINIIEKDSQNLAKIHGDSRENISTLTEEQVPHSTVRLVDKLSVVHLASSVVAIASVIAGENQRHVRLHYGQS